MYYEVYLRGAYLFSNGTRYAATMISYTKIKIFEGALQCVHLCCLKQFECIDIHHMYETPTVSN